MRQDAGALAGNELGEVATYFRPGFYGHTGVEPVLSDEFSRLVAQQPVSGVVEQRDGPLRVQSDDDFGSYVQVPLSHVSGFLQIGLSLLAVSDVAVDRVDRLLLPRDENRCDDKRHVKEGSVLPASHSLQENLLALACGPRYCPRFFQLCWRRHQVVDTLSDSLVSPVAKHAHKLGVHPEDPALGASDRNGFRGCLHQSVEEHSFTQSLLLRLLALGDVQKRHHRTCSYPVVEYRVGPILGGKRRIVGAPEHFVVHMYTFSIMESLDYAALFHRKRTSVQTL